MNYFIKKSTSPRQQDGVGIIEIMISITLGMLLLLGAGTLFISNKGVYRNAEEIGRLYGDAQVAINMITRDIRMAGFVGCHFDIENIRNRLNNVTGESDLYNISNPIEGREAGVVWMPSNADTPLRQDQYQGQDKGESGVRVFSTDALTIRYFSGSALDVNAPMAGPDGSISVDSGALQLQTGDIAAISDCNNADLFVATNVSTGGSTITISHDTTAFKKVRIGVGSADVRNQDKALSRVYNDNARVRRFVSVRYYVGHSSTYDGRSLFRQNSDGQFQELIQGVENLQILYGVDTDNDRIPDNYHKAGSIINWDNVVSVKFAFLMRTLQPSKDRELDSGPYQLLDINFIPTELRVHRDVFSSTVQIRNRRG